MRSKESPKATGAEPGSLVGRRLRSLQPGPLSPRKGAKSLEHNQFSSVQLFSHVRLFATP